MIGAGRLGSSLALAMRAQGAQLTGYTCLSPSGRGRAQQWLGFPAAPDVAHLVASKPHWYVLSVPDAAIAEVAAELAASLAGGAEAGAPTNPQSRPFVTHTSGVSSVEVLRPCADAGAVTLAFHPLQTFSEPLSGSTRFTGAAVAVTPELGPLKDVATEAGFSLARALGSRPFLLEDAKRVIYHAAACMASNYFVTLESCAQRLFMDAGMPEEEALSLFLPLVRAALENLASQGPTDALTGPLSRGDLGTIADHLEALSHSAPDLATVYRCLGIATLDLVRARGDVDLATLSNLAALLGSSEAPRRP